MASPAIDIGPASGPHVELKPKETNGTAPPNGQSAATRERHEEHQYLDLIRDILRNGEHRPDRTGTGTLAIPFPPQHRYTLSRPDGTLILPLLTTKRVFLRAVLAELLWFVSGDTNARTLQDQNVKIWDGNASAEYLASVGLGHREPGDLGPVYGFQWRHFGARYGTCRDEYAGQGVDQLAEVVRKLRHTPYDRRIILSAWNPADLKLMALPPCHMFAQFYVSFPASAPTREDGSKRGTLQALLYQRSCDMGLGVPFNIASYALLTHMLARACDLVPGSLTHTMGDAHVYLDHREALEVQITRTPRDFPTLGLKREAGCEIDGWRADDFEVLENTSRATSSPRHPFEFCQHEHQPSAIGPGHGEQPGRDSRGRCLSAYKKRCAEVEARLQWTAEKDARLAAYDETKRAALHTSRALCDTLRHGEETAEEEQAAREAELQERLADAAAATAAMRAGFPEERARYSVQVHMLRCMISALKLEGGLKALGELRELLGTLLGMLSTVAGGMVRKEEAGE